VVLTVAVPYYRAAGFIDVAVRSILNQTYRDLVCVVIGDGDEPPISHIHDSRLIIYTLPENHGTYFAQAVALAACQSDWFSIHAADDWSDPDRFGRLMAASSDVDAVFGGSVQHHGQIVTRRPVHFDKAGDRPRHVASIATAIVRTEAVQAFGWWSQPEFRVAYDSMMVNLVIRVLRWRHIPGEYGYHRIVRDDSLTRTPATGLNSAYRLEASARRADLWDRVIAAPQKDWPELLAPSPLVAAEVTEHAQRLREML
jgi:glycosyltransferase involved in cell wall biosynthesis